MGRSKSSSSSMASSGDQGRWPASCRPGLGHSGLHGQSSASVATLPTVTAPTAAGADSACSPGTAVLWVPYEIFELV